VEAPSTPSGRRTLTPAVLLAVIFTTACALASVAFVAARGGLDLPLAVPGPSDVARASIAPSPAGTPLETSVPAPSATAPMPSTAPVTSPAPTTTPAATPGPTPDPLAALPACPNRPGCYEYTVQRGDTLSTISDHWGLSLRILEALNPQLASPRTIVVGQTLFLGRTPFVRLQACPNAPRCYIYVVRPGDRLSTIATRYRVTIQMILAFNLKITDPNAIFSGETIRLPGPG
jgi:nucleoid-associated protein YgaU